MWSKESSNMPWGQPNFTGNAEQDWATLAKQWMQHRDMVGMPVLVNQQFPVAPSPLPQPIMQQFPQQLLPPQLQMQNYNDDYMRNNLLAQQQETVNFSNMESCNSLVSGSMGLVNTDYHPPPVQQSVNVPTGMNNNWNVPQWAVAPPPPPPPLPTDTSELLEESLVHEESDYFASRDIDTEAPDSMTQPPPSSGYMSTFSNSGDFLPVSPVVKRVWMPSAASNMTTTTNIPATSRPVLSNPSWLSNNNNSNNFKDLPFLDAAKRKTLPAWIRDGLEKMEREKYRQMERQKLEEEYRRRKSLQEGTGGEEDVDEHDEDDDDVSGALLKGGGDGGGLHEPESESTAAADDGNGREMDRDVDDKEADEVENDGDDEDDDVKKEEELSDGEKEAMMMEKVRRMLTEVLLDVTCNEVISVATFVYNKAKSKQLKAPVRSLATSSALASISRLGEEYDSCSEEDSLDGGAVENDEDGDDDDEDFDEAMKKIRMKRKAFEEKMSLLNSQSTSQYPSTRSATNASNTLETKVKSREGTSESTTSAPGDQPPKQEKKNFHVAKNVDSSDSLSRATTTSSSITSSSESDAERKAKKKRKSFKIKKDSYLEKNIDNINKVKKRDDNITSKCSDKKKELAKDEKDHSKKNREVHSKTSSSGDAKLKNYDLNENLPTKIAEVKSRRLKTPDNHRNKSSERRSKSRNKSSKAKNRKKSRSRERKSRSAERSRKAKRFKDRSSRSREKKSKRSSHYSKLYSRTEKHYTYSRSRS